MKAKSSLGWSPLGLFLLLVMATAQGCGEDTVDAGAVEKGIKAELSSETVKVASVSCPDDVKKEKDDTFTCDATLDDGGQATVTVTQVNGRDRYDYAFKPGTLVINGDTLEPVLERELEALGISVSGVSCPKSLEVHEGERVTCTATTAKGLTTEITFTLTAAGEIDSSSVKSSAS